MSIQLKEQLTDIQKQLARIEERQIGVLKMDFQNFVNQKESELDRFLTSIMISVIIGVIGNLFVSLLFQPESVFRNYSLVISASILFPLVGVLTYYLTIGRTHYQITYEKAQLKSSD